MNETCHTEELQGYETEKYDKRRCDATERKLHQMIPQQATSEELRLHYIRYPHEC